MIIPAVELFPEGLEFFFDLLSHRGVSLVEALEESPGLDVALQLSVSVRGVGDLIHVRPHPPDEPIDPS